MHFLWLFNEQTLQHVFWICSESHKYSQICLKFRLWNSRTSLERDEARRVRGTNTRPAVLDWFVRDAELCQVVTNHLGLQKTCETTMLYSYHYIIIMAEAIFNH